MPRLVSTDASGESVDYVVKSEPVTIGRSAECVVHVTDSAVSRLHAVVERSNGKLVIQDHSGKTGVLVNGDKVEEKAELDEGDEVTIGEATFSVKLADPPGARSSRRIGEDGEPIRPSRRQKREVLGGVRLTKKGQTIVKIVSAAICFLCIVGAVWLMAGYQRPATVHVTRKTVIDPMTKPKALANEARDMAKLGRKEEHKGNTDEALKHYQSAKAKIEEATALVEELAQKYSGEGYEWVEKEAVSLNTQAQGIRQDLFRIEMQKMRQNAGHK